MATSHHVHGHMSNHTTVHLIPMKSIHGDEIGLLKLRHVCKEIHYNWANELERPFYNMFPLKFQHPYNSSYFETWGVKGVGGHIKFKDVSENRFYNTPNVTFLPGLTLMPECHWQHYNPAHLMFPFSVLFEWGQSPPPHLPVFDRLLEMKCPSWGEYLNHWEWARIVLETSLASLLEKGHFGKDAQKEALAFARSSTFQTDEQPVTNVPYPAPQFETHPYSFMLSPKIRDEPDLPGYEGFGERGRERRLLCFETLYIVQRWGLLMNNGANARAFREKAIDTFRKRYPTDTIPASEIDDDPAAIRERCATNSLRILIQQRSPDHGDRVFLNSDDVLATASNFTSHARNVHMFITRFHEQVQLYNSFDILVTTTGSHLTNLIFTNRSNVAILEVGLAIRDWFWRDNAYRFGIRHYLYSHIGHTPSEKCYQEGKVDNTCVVHKTEEDAITCPPRGIDTWHPIGDCSLIVNITTFKVRLEKTIQTLCDSVAKI